jgi:hypothetical protein
LPKHGLAQFVQLRSFCLLVRFEVWENQLNQAIKCRIGLGAPPRRDGLATKRASSLRADCPLDTLAAEAVHALQSAQLDSLSSWFRS